MTLAALWKRKHTTQSCTATKAHEPATLFNANGAKLKVMGDELGITHERAKEMTSYNVAMHHGKGADTPCSVNDAYRLVLVEVVETMLSDVKDDRWTQRTIETMELVAKLVGITEHAEEEIRAHALVGHSLLWERCATKVNEWLTHDAPFH